MQQDQPRTPASWANVCPLVPRLRQLAKESGHLAEWRRLGAAARDGKDSLEEWQELCVRIARDGEWYDSYAIRDGLGDEDPPGAYGCPSHRRCGRTAEGGRRGEPPECHLAGMPMTALGG